MAHNVLSDGKLLKCYNVINVVVYLAFFRAHSQIATGSDKKFLFRDVA